VTGFLLDTNVVSEFRRQRPHGAVIAWLASIRDADLNISVATVHELQAGIELTRLSNAARADELEDWLDDVLGAYAVIPADAEVFRKVARIMHRKPEHLFMDAVIAATAMTHGLVVATRNVKDFQVFGAPVINPFEFR
jgi:toxin FitB